MKLNSDSKKRISSLYSLESSCILYSKARINEPKINKIIIMKRISLVDMITILSNMMP